jgi:hypothetical protein
MSLRMKGKIDIIIIVSSSTKVYLVKLGKFISFKIFTTRINTYVSQNAINITN